MGKPTLFDRIRRFISDVAFTVFLWANRMTEDEYRNNIFEYMLEYEDDFHSDPSNR